MCAWIEDMGPLERDVPGRTLERAFRQMTLQADIARFINGICVY